MKKNWFLLLIIAATFVVGAIAIITAFKLFQKKPVAPTAPQETPAVVPGCALDFTISTQLPTGTPTPTGELTGTPTPTKPTITPTPTSTLITTPTPTSTSKLGCRLACSSDDDCEGTLVCLTVSGTKMCVTSACSNETDCICNKDCWEICGQNSECSSDQACRSIDGTYRCVNPSCDREQDCNCAVSTPTPTVVSRVTATPTPTKIVAVTTPTPKPTTVELPKAGFPLPTISVVLGGILLLGLALVLGF